MGRHDRRLASITASAALIDWFHCSKDRGVDRHDNVGPPKPPAIPAGLGGLPYRQPLTAGQAPRSLTKGLGLEFSRFS